MAEGDPWADVPSGPTTLQFPGLTSTSTTSSLCTGSNIHSFLRCLASDALNGGSGNCTQHHGPSTALKVGLGVGIPVGVILLVALSVFMFLKRHRKKNGRKTQQPVKPTPQTADAPDIVGGGKAELIGSTFQGHYESRIRPVRNTVRARDVI
ncbi:hypothetical protein F4802DRAFT_545857 [Xylaria palmicola]|nr:hypothetical protein F4802DRAFT_545857 [Xylaria palmicola]